MKLPGFAREYSGLPRSIYVLFWARVINSMGSFVFPLLTLFLTDKLGLGPRQTGYFISLASLSYVPGAIIGGKLSDVMGRKKVLIIFQGLVAVCFIPCAFLGKSILIPWLLILAGVLNGAAQPANSAMVADITNQENRKSAFSLLYLGINIGFSIGPLIAGFLYRNFLPWTFIGNAIAICISLALVAIYVDETIPMDRPREDDFVSEDEKAQSGSIFAVLFKRPQMLIFALLSTIYTFAYSQGNFSTTLLLKQLFTENSSKMLGGIYFTNGIVVVTMTTLIVHITRRNKPILNIALAGVFFAFGFGIMYFIKVYPLFILSTLVWTIGEILNATNSGVYIADHTPMSHRGRFNSMLSLITGFGSFIGPLVMGGYIEHFTVRAVWPLVFVVTMISALLMYILSLSEKSRHNS